MRKKDTSSCSLGRLKKIADQMQQPGLSNFEKVALRSHYTDVLEELRDKFAHKVKLEV